MARPSPQHPHPRFRPWLNKLFPPVPTSTTLAAFVRDLGTTVVSHNSASGSLTVGGSGVPVGDTLTVEVGQSGATAFTPVVSDSQGNRWWRAGRQGEGSGQPVTVYYCYVRQALGAGDTITVTTGSSVDLIFGATQFTGITNPVVDVKAFQEVASASVAAGPTAAVDTQDAVAVAVAMTASASVGFTQPGPGWTQLQVSGGASGSLGREYRVIADRTAQTFKGAWASSVSFDALLVVLMSGGADVPGLGVTPKHPSGRFRPWARSFTATTPAPHAVVNPAPIAGVATVTATVVRDRARSAASAGAAAVTATVVRLRARTAAATGTATVTAAVVRVRARTAAAAGAATITAVVTRTRALTASSVGTSTVAGAISPPIVSTQAGDGAGWWGVVRPARMPSRIAQSQPSIPQETIVQLAPAPIRAGANVTADLLTTADWIDDFLALALDPDDPLILLPA